MGYPVMQEPSTTCGVGRVDEGLPSGVLLANVAANVGVGLLETDVGSDTDATVVVDVKVHVLAVSVAGSASAEVGASSSANRSKVANDAATFNRPERL
jgi:hypothetical protein